MMKRSHNISQILQVALGVMLIVWPSATLRTGVRVIAIGLILIAAAGAVSYLEGQRRGAEEILKLVGSIALLIAGVYGIFHTTRVIHRLPVLIGVVIMASAAYRCWLIAKGSGDRAELSACALALLLGLIVAINPFRTTRLFSIVAGLTMLYNVCTGWWMERGR